MCRYIEAVKADVRRRMTPPQPVAIGQARRRDNGVQIGAIGRVLHAPAQARARNSHRGARTTTSGDGDVERGAPPAH